MVAMHTYARSALQGPFFIKGRKKAQNGTLVERYLVAYCYGLSYPAGKP